MNYECFDLLYESVNCCYKMKDEGHVLVTFALTRLPLKILMWLSAALKKKSKCQRQRRSRTMYGGCWKFSKQFINKQCIFFYVGLTSPR